jgi:hypothetical protein
VTGLISVYSSTSAVVLPAFLPTVPGLVARLGGDPFSVASSMNVGATPGGHVAALDDGRDVPRRNFRSRAGQTHLQQAPGMGLSMTIVGAVGCYLLL